MSAARMARSQYQTSFTPNDADGQVSEYFVAGFDAGFWGGSGTSPNPLVTTNIDFSKTWNWTVNYAYNAALDPSAVTYTNVLGTGPGTPGGNNRFYDPWAQQFLTQSNAYGYSYSDLVSAGGVNPQMTMWDAGRRHQRPDHQYYAVRQQRNACLGLQGLEFRLCGAGRGRVCRQSDHHHKPDRVHFRLHSRLLSISLPTRTRRSNSGSTRPRVLRPTATGSSRWTVTGSSGDWYYYQYRQHGRDVVAQSGQRDRREWFLQSAECARHVGRFGELVSARLWRCDRADDLQHLRHDRPRPPRTSPAWSSITVSR